MIQQDDSLYSSVLLLFCHLSTISIARRYASAVHAVVVYPSVRLSVRLSHAGIVSKRLNVESRKQRHTIAQGL